MSRGERRNRTDRVRRRRWNRTASWLMRPCVFSGTETPLERLSRWAWFAEGGRYAKYNGACQCRICKAGRERYRRASADHHWRGEWSS